MSSFAERRASLQARSPALMRVATIATLLLIPIGLGLLLDPRQVGGAPAWLKPAKFAASTVIYALTMAWMVEELPRTRALTAACWFIGWFSLLETVLVSIQAARGTASHFNIEQPVDFAIYGAMGIGIIFVWVSSMAVLWLHLQSPARDRALALAFRLGLALNILGAGSGWIMSTPSQQQFAFVRQGGHPRIVGAHTVGAPDDSAPGMPILHWSRTHGDLRAAHFLGMHAFQVLPLLLVFVRRARRAPDEARDRRLVLVSAAVCAAVFTGVLALALSGRPLLPLPTG